MEQTTSTTSTATSTQPSQGSYVQSLIDPAVDLGSETSGATEDTQQDTAAETGTTPASAETTTGDSTKEATALPSVDDLIQTFATETGLNADDPDQRKTLKRLADKELFIRKLQADNEALKGTAAAPKQDAPEFMTDFEKELMAAETAAKPITETAGARQGEQPQQTAKTSETAQPRGYGDIGDAWKTPEDSLTALNEAWSKNDLKAVQEIEMARLLRNFDSRIAPGLLNHIGQMLDQRLKGFVEKDLGDVVPEVRRTVADRRVAQCREFAIDQLRKAGANDIDKLFDAEDGPPIKFDGQEFPNTPLNRILAKHPEIMQITAQHSDPATAERKGFIARYKLAYQIYKQGATGVPAATAKALVDAGRDIKHRQTEDRTRQALNAGKGTSGVGTDKNANKSYVSSLNNLPGEVPFASLLG